jgi:type II secretory pathway pseudopilin PulG
LLVVITIIGMLAAISATYLLKGWNAAKQSRTAAEVTNLAGAMEEFRRAYGDYPPSYLDHTDATALALMKRFLAKAFPRCNPNVEVWYIPWCDASNSYYPYKDSFGAIKFWDPTGVTASNAQPMTPAQALVFWLTSISKDPAHPLSAQTADRVSYFDFDNSRITRLNRTASATNSISGSAWTVVTAGSPPSWVEGPTAASPGSYPKYNPGTYAPRDGNQQGYVYFEARCYLLHALFLASKFPTTNPPSDVPYLARSAPWNTDGQVNLTAGSGFPPAYDVPIDTVTGILGTANGSNQSFTAFQKLCVNPKSFQIIAAGLDNDFGTVNTAYTPGGAPGTPAPGVPVTYNPGSLSSPQSYIIYYKSYPDGQGYDTNTNADDDNITNFSEGPLGNRKFER